MAGPKRELFKSSDVCEMAQLQPYVLRTWETEFPGLGQVPTTGGPRLYRRSDVELVLRIRELVFTEGLTLAGARRRLEEDAEPASPSLASLAVDDVLDDMAKARLRDIRHGLQAILDLLSRNAAAGVTELHLVAPDEGTRTGERGRQTKTAKAAATRRGSGRA
jgi:DNA-binding transcriptional MerR regulator